jgi:rhodanese-related sulfurtransferase
MIAAPTHRLIRQWCATIIKSMDHLTPKETFEFLAKHPDSLFIDCRSDAEYFFVGHALGSMHVGWYDGPDWELNTRFVEEVKSLAEHDIKRPVVLICRSGKRSVEAGEALETGGFTHVINVLFGFEGERDDKNQRGNLNGWRRDGLPWEQL